MPPNINSTITYLSTTPIYITYSNSYVLRLLFGEGFQRCIFVQVCGGLRTKYNKD